MHTCFILQYIHYNPLHVLLTVHLSISLDNDQLDAYLLYFTVRPLQSSTCSVDLHLSISLDTDQLDAHLLYFSIRPLHSSTCFKH